MTIITNPIIHSITGDTMSLSKIITITLSLLIIGLIITPITSSIGYAIFKKTGIQYILNAINCNEEKQIKAIDEKIPEKIDKEIKSIINKEIYLKAYSLDIDNNKGNLIIFYNKRYCSKEGISEEELTKLKRHFVNEGHNVGEIEGLSDEYPELLRYLLGPKKTYIFDLNILKKDIGNKETIEDYITKKEIKKIINISEYKTNPIDIKHYSEKKLEFIN